MLPYPLILKKGAACMAICPTCGKMLKIPNKKIQNSFFTIENYTCDSCGTTFKESH
jgi:DNA-directed RNA polymerase subunit M/transcription elongation factor TFIIS